MEISSRIIEMAKKVKMTDTTSTLVVFGLLVLSMEAGATIDSTNHVSSFCPDGSSCEPSSTEYAPNYDENSRKEEDYSKSAEYPEEPIDMTELIFNCIFSSVPYVGGIWLTKIMRRRIADDTLMEASYSFMEGGKLLGRVMGFDSKSPAVLFFDRLDACFDEDTHYLADYDDVIHDNNDVINHVSDVTGSIRLLNRTEYQAGKTSSDPLTRNKRSSDGYKKKKGKDSLIGFSILGILIVGAMIAYLIYLLT